MHVRSVFLSTLLASVVSAGAAAAAPGVTPTFTKDVAPILHKRCVECHRQGEVAPMSLITYEQARPWAKAIRTKVINREMPPWHADPQFGTFKDDRRLTQQEIDTIAAWADGGAPMGNASDMPAPPTFVEGWKHGKPDFVFEAPEVSIVSDGEMDLQYFWVQIPFKEDRFIDALELRPSNPSVVHHARADVADLPEGAKVVDGKLVVSEAAVQTDRRQNRPAVDPFNFARSTLISYIPGNSVEVHPAGTAKRLEGGKWVRLEVHYTPSGQPEKDSMKLGVWFAKGPITHEVFTMLNPRALVPGKPGEPTYIVEGVELKPTANANGGRRVQIPNIPPRAENWELKAVIPVPEAITVNSLLPHMHLRGKDLKWVLTLPDGREQTLLSVPKYDFNWQILYQFKNPVKVPAGSTITTIAHWDNSLNNKYNPAPNTEVIWSDQSWNEMFVPYMEYTIDSQNLVKPGATSQQQQQP
jgi:hypothetical protein